MKLRAGFSGDQEYRDESAQFALKVAALISVCAAARGDEPMYFAPGDDTFVHIGTTRILRRGDRFLNATITFLRAGFYAAFTFLIYGKEAGLGTAVPQLTVPRSSTCARPDWLGRIFVARP